MPSQQLATRVEDAKVEGWSVKSDEGNRVVLIKRNYGPLWAHLLIALLTVWWTGGLINLAYGLYCLKRRSEQKVLRADDGRHDRPDEF